MPPKGDDSLRTCELNAEYRSDSQAAFQAVIGAARFIGREDAHTEGATGGMRRPARPGRYSMNHTVSVSSAK
jgi:hypothetical protein